MHLSNAHIWCHPSHLEDLWAIRYFIWIAYSTILSHLSHLTGTLAVNKIRSKFYMAMSLILNSMLHILQTCSGDVGFGRFTTSYWGKLERNLTQIAAQASVSHITPGWTLAIDTIAWFLFVHAMAIIQAVCSPFTINTRLKRQVG